MRGERDLGALACLMDEAVSWMGGGAAGLRLVGGGWVWWAGAVRGGGGVS